MQKYQNILIDGTNSFFRAYFKNLEKALEIDDYDIYPNTIKDAFKRIRDIEVQFSYKRQDHKIWILFDNPLSAINLRKVISEGAYKNNRCPDDLPKGFYNTLNLFIELLKIYDNNFKIVKLSSSEADDLTQPLLNIIQPTEKYKSLCISADMDWARNITDNVHWFNYTDVHTPKTFKDKYGFSPVGKKVIMYKAIHGDTIDRIPNAIPNLRKEILLDIINRFDTIGDLIETLYTLNYDKDIKKEIKDSQRQLVINEQLAGFVPINCSIQDIIVDSKENTAELRWWFKRLGLKLESRMIDTNDKFKNFFSKKKIVVRKYINE